MKFEYKEHILALLVFPVVIIALLILIIIMSKGAVFNFADMYFIGIFIVCLCYISFGMLAFSRLKYGIFLLLEKESDVKTMTGKVENVYNSHFTCAYYIYKGHKTHTKVVVVNGIKMYFMSIFNLRVGDIIEVKYLPKSKIVLEANKVEEEHRNHAY